MVEAQLRVRTRLVEALAGEYVVVLWQDPSMRSRFLAYPARDLARVKAWAKDYVTTNLDKSQAHSRMMMLRIAQPTSLEGIRVEKSFPTGKLTGTPLTTKLHRQLGIDPREPGVKVRPRRV